MKILTQSLQNIKSYLPPSEFYRSELTTMQPPREGGWCDGGLCPFHDDKKAGSFRVNLETGAFKCFACETRGGDIIAFVQHRDGLSFSDTVQKLTDDWGL